MNSLNNVQVSVQLERNSRNFKNFPGFSRPAETLKVLPFFSRRGQFLGMITNTGNNSETGQVQTLPVWQQVAANERSTFSDGDTFLQKSPKNHN